MKLYTIDEAAKVIGFSRATLLKRIRKTKRNMSKVGNTFALFQSDIDFLKEEERKAKIKKEKRQRAPYGAKAINQRIDDLVARVNKLEDILLERTIES